MFRSLCILLLFLSGCSEQPIDSNNSKPKVLSTVAMIHDLVKEIGQDKIEAEILIQDDLDPHTYELVKGDDEKFMSADIVFCNGLGLEHGLSLRKLIESNPKSVLLGEKIDSSFLLQTEGQKDPHIWMDISLWATLIDPIVHELSLKDPAHAEEFRMRGDSLREKMLTADADFFRRLQSVPQEKRFIVTTHNAFHYFTRRYLAEESEKSEGSWVVRVTAPEGLAPDAEISLSDIKAILEHIQKYHVTILFPESNLSKDALYKIMYAGKEMGLSLRLSKESVFGDSMGGNSYLGMMEHNVSLIAKELENK